MGSGPLTDPFPVLTEGKVLKSSARLPGPRAEIDTMAVAYPVEAAFETKGSTAQVFGFGTAGESWRYRQMLPGGGFLALGMGGKAWVEASLPKRVGDENVEALPVVVALEVMRSACEEAAEFCTPDRTRKGHRFEEAKVIRLDPVRDFDGVRHPGALMDGLAGVPRGPREKVRRWSDSERNQAESIRVGPKAWGALLYDKHRESDGKAPEGRLRFEVRLHSDQMTGAWARDLGAIMRCVGDVNEEKVTAIRRGAFERVGYDREVSAMTTISDAVFSCEDVSVRERAVLWAYLTAPGFSASLHRDTERKYRRVAKRLGVTPGAALEEAHKFTVRLDFDGGIEVLGAAA